MSEAVSGLPHEAWDERIGNPFVNVGADTDLTIRELEAAAQWFTERGPAHG